MNSRKRDFSVALLITTYNRPDALHLVLSAVAAGTVMPDEVLVADDGSDAARERCWSPSAARRPLRSDISGMRMTASASA